jgi:methylenetetrahydrofolate dehydrogenase (NADP+)/methenyltetrahydrofolate cyclohydrolase
MEVIDGKAIAAQLVAEVGAGVAALRARNGVVPGLAVVLVGDDPASTIYVRRKLAMTGSAGIRSFEYRLSADTTQSALLALIDELNVNADVHGILVQLPLPPQIEPLQVLDRIAPEKDATGLHEATGSCDR